MWREAKRDTSKEMNQQMRKVLDFGEAFLWEDVSESRLLWGSFPTGPKTDVLLLRRDNA